MNKIFTTYHSLTIITTIMCAGNINCQDNPPNLSIGQILYLNKFTIASSAAASKWDKNQPAQRAAIKTTGFACDLISKAGSNINNIQIRSIIGTFIGNYVTEKVYEYARYYGLSVDALAKKCDILPNGPVRDIVNPITRIVVDTITDNQIGTIMNS